MIAVSFSKSLKPPRCTAAGIWTWWWVILLANEVLGILGFIVQYQKNVSHPFLALGETGIGKSTLMDTLFNTNFENFESSHFEPQVKLRAQTYDLQESNVRLRLTVVNTVGFGDQMNKQERWEEACARVLLIVKKSHRLKVFKRVYK